MLSYKSLWMGLLDNEAREFLTHLSLTSMLEAFMPFAVYFIKQRLSLINDDVRRTSHLFQRVSVLIQRYNAVAFHDSFVEEDGWC